MNLGTLIHLLAQTDSGLFQEIRSPGFGNWLVYLLVCLLVADRLKSWFSPSRTEVSGILSTKKQAAFADEEEVKELRQELDELREENAAQHRAAATAGQNRVTDLSRVLDTETQQLAERIDLVQEKLAEKLEQGFAGLHDKLNGVALKAAEHAAQLPDLKERIAELTARYNQAIPKLHERIDDAMRAKSRA